MLYQPTETDFLLQHTFPSLSFPRENFELSRQEILREKAVPLDYLEYLFITRQTE
jgi:hypothetical protein